MVPVSVGGRCRNRAAASDCEGSSMREPQARQRPVASISLLWHFGQSIDPGSPPRHVRFHHSVNGIIARGSRRPRAGAGLEPVGGAARRQCILTSMSFRARSRVMIAAVISLGAAYGAARHYSRAIVAYVVEETLVEKAPPGANPADVHGRFRALTGAIADPDARLERMLQI